MKDDFEVLLKASDISHIHHLAENFAAGQYELMKRIITDLHLIKKKLEIKDL